MHCFNTVALVGTLLMATATASTPASFEVPGAAPSTTVLPEVDTTTIFVTSTHHLTAGVTVTSSVATNVVLTSTVDTTSIGYAPPAEPTPTTEPSLFVTASQTLIPVTLIPANTTTVIYPQNSTAIETPTNGTASAPSTILVTHTASTNTSTRGSATVSASASIIEVPINTADKVTGDVLMLMCIIAGFIALL